jgi:hypothetical protein
MPAVAVALFTTAAARAQAPAAAAPAPGAGVAATVNGQPIPESAVQRALQLQRVPPARHAEARPSVIDFLVDKALIDQYLVQLKIDVEKKDLDSRLEQIKADIVKQGQTVEKVLKDLLLTEPELRAEVGADLRWEKFVDRQGTEAELRKFFDANRESFDGSQVRARHILLTPPSADAKAVEQAKAQLEAFRKQVEEAAAAAVTKAPAGADPLAREKARIEALEQAFAGLAREHSACPTKKNGGDVDWFPRTGGMVEPFARAAFAVKPYQMTEVVRTQFGLHLILVTERRPGRDVKFEDVKAEVKDVYGERLREAVIAYMKPRAAVVLASQK